METTSTASGAAVAETERQEDVTTAERCVAFSRGVVLTTALLMLEGEAVMGLRPFGAVDALALVAVIYLVGTSVLSTLGREREGLQFPLLAADMVLITGIIHVAGGVHNEYYLLYYVPILQASVRLNFRDAIATALLSSGMYCLVGLSSSPNASVTTTAQLRASTFAASAVFMAAFFALLSREARTHLKRSTEMTDLAGALAAKNRELEEKTRQLAEAQENLLASERLATIGELAASLGHELRNPLGVIRNAAYCLRTRAADDEPSVEMIDLMDAQVSTCDRTIAALLDFARPEQAMPQPVDVNALVTQAVRANGRLQEVSVKLDLASDLPLVQADRHQVEQVFNNIVSNACQAMDGRGELSVRSGVDESNGMAFIEFSDTGPGIPPDNLARIFDPLFTTKAKGIGLGLVVCKRLVERQGGELHVRNEVGKGASFTVMLRLADEMEVADNG